MHGEAQLVQGAHEAGVLSLCAILGVIARQKREVHAAGTGQMDVRVGNNRDEVLVVLRVFGREMEVAKMDPTQNVGWGQRRKITELVFMSNYKGLRFQRKVSLVGSEPRPHYPLASFRALTRRKIKVRRRLSRPKQENQ